MNDCDGILGELVAQARALGIPVPENVEPHVRLNSRSVTRFGCCKKQGDRFLIEVATRVANGPEESCRETLAHELLHTCPRCQDHGARWKEYAGRMNRAYGYKIQRTTTDEALGVTPVRDYRYVFQCERCGVRLGRYKASPLTRHPERYRCRCGGRLKRIETPEPLGHN